MEVLVEKSSIGVQQAMFHCRRVLDPSIRKTVSKPSFALDSFFGGGQHSILSCWGDGIIWNYTRGWACMWTMHPWRNLSRLDVKFAVHQTKTSWPRPKKMCLSKIPFDPSIRLYQSSWNQKSRLFRAYDCPFASALRQCHDRRGSSPGRVSQRTTSPTFRLLWTGPVLSQHFPARHSGARYG